MAEGAQQISAAIDPDSVTALIFAGGQAKRMGGVNKAMKLLNGRPMIEHVLHSFDGIASKIVISANRDEAIFSKYGAVLRDAFKGFPGPLGALDALAMTEVSAQWILTTPCDAPFVSADIWRRLIAAAEHSLRAQESGALGFVPIAGGRRQSTFMLLHKDALQTVRPFLMRGERKLGLWQEEADFCMVPMTSDMDSMFLNVNTLEELQALQKKA